MLHRDYLLEIIEQFVNTVFEGLRIARAKHDPQAISGVESAVGELLDLDPEVALRLSPDSLVTMMLLSGMGDALADYVTFSLNQLAGVYEEMGDDKTAALRRAQAVAVAESFGCDPEVVPAEFAAL
jgi:hypothetical protein